MIKNFKQFILENLGIDNFIEGEQANASIQVIIIENTYDENNNEVETIKNDPKYMDLFEIADLILELRAYPVFVSDFYNIKYSEINESIIDKNCIFITPPYTTDKYPELETEKSIQPQFIDDEQARQVIKILKRNESKQ